VKKTTLNVKGMSCNHCVMAVTQAVGSMNGISEVNVDLEDGTVTLAHSEAVNLDDVKEKIDDLGYEVV